jgi:Transposase DDE domain
MSLLECSPISRAGLELVQTSASLTRLRCCVCDPKRISAHRVFAADARRAVSSMGWFFGFKLHLAVNDRGDLLACCLTPGDIDDRTPVPHLVKRLRGKLFGDRGSISASLTQMLFEQPTGWVYDFPTSSEG